MSSFKTGSSNKKLQPGTVIVGENGLPVDTIATITGSYQIIKNTTTPLTYNAGVVTVNAAISLLPARGHKSRYTGKLILQTVDKGLYFIDKITIDDTTKSFNIYNNEAKTSIPTSIDLSAGWIIAEAEIVNRLATTSAAKIDNIEFRDMQFQIELDGDPVTVRGQNGNTIEPNEDGSLNIGNVVQVDTDLTNVENKLDELIGEAQASNQSLVNIDNSVKALEPNLDTINQSVQAVDLSVQSLVPELQAIETAVDQVEAKLDVIDQSVQAVESAVAQSNTHLQAIEDALAAPLEIAQPIKVAGTEDGSSASPAVGVVYSLRQQILDAKDRVANFTYADFGTKDQRITKVEYTSSIFPGNKVVREFTYTPVLGRYRRDSETWNIE